MEHTMVHIAEGMGVALVLVFIFAIIGVIATIRWIIGLFTAGERAVESGVQNVENTLTRHDQ
jgi:hypothetical protein